MRDYDQPRPYIFLRKEIRLKKLKLQDIANHLGISRGALSRRMNQKEEWRLGEALAIKKLLNTPATIEQLFDPERKNNPWREP